MHSSFMPEDSGGEGAPPPQPSFAAAAPRSHKPPAFGEGPTALLRAPVVSCRLSVVVLCMLATGSQLILRSVPFVAMVGDEGMAAEFDWDEAEVHPRISLRCHATRRRPETSPLLSGQLAVFLKGALRGLSCAGRDRLRGIRLGLRFNAGYRVDREPVLWRQADLASLPLRRGVLLSAAWCRSGRRTVG